MVCNAEAVLGFYFLMGILIKSWLGVEVTFDSKSHAWLITIHVG
ncbi:hypothetical protein [Helicobacter pylori]|nr:hypothetical protein [Helicobacter pylori]